MIRRRIITLDITTDEGRPEEWDWESLLDLGPRSRVKIVHVEREEP